MTKKKIFVSMIFVFTLLFGLYSDAYACHAIIVGNYKDSNNNFHGFYYDSGTYPYYFAIDIPDATSTRSYKINDNSNVVGSYVKNNVTHGYIYNIVSENHETIDYPSASATVVNGINNDDYIVGQYKDSSGDWHGFFYDGDDYTSIDYPQADATYCTGLNNNNDGYGEMVGYWTDSNGKITAFYYDWTNFTSIEPACAEESRFRSINDDGVMVGWYRDCDEDTHGYLYEKNTSFTIFKTIDINAGTKTYCGGINDDNGVIVGGYADSNGVWKYGFKLAGSTLTVLEYPNAVETIPFGISNDVYQ